MVNVSVRTATPVQDKIDTEKNANIEHTKFDYGVRAIVHKSRTAELLQYLCIIQTDFTDYNYCLNIMVQVTRLHRNRTVGGGLPGKLGPEFVE